MRVVGGEARGRKLQAPPGRDTRPTSDFVREAIFNMIASRLDLTDAVCVDLFAGSGALGIEALSRGAAEVTFVEKDGAATSVIKANLAAVGLDGGTVVQSEVLRWLPTPPVDVVFADPPYAFGAWPEVLTQLDASLVVLESDRAIDVGEAWEMVKERRSGSTVVSLIRPSAGGEESGVTIALIPGSFDPIHNGHLAIIEPAARLFEHVVVAAIRNSGKDPLFTLEEREELLAEALAHLPNVTTRSFAGLSVGLAIEIGATVIVKGVRTGSDLDTELQQAQMNHRMSGVDTLLVPTTSASSFLSSRYIKDFARNGWSDQLSSVLPETVARRLKEKYT